MSLTEVLKRVGRITGGAVSLRKREPLLAKKREPQAHAEEFAVKEESTVKEDAVVKEKAAVEEEPAINSGRRKFQNSPHSFKNMCPTDILIKFRELDKIPRIAYASRIGMLVFSQ